MKSKLGHVDYLNLSFSPGLGGLVGSGEALNLFRETGLQKLLAEP